MLETLERDYFGRISESIFNYPENHAFSPNWRGGRIKDLGAIQEDH
jgi:hypothetical protein